MFIDIARFDTDHWRTINFARLQRTHKTAHRLHGRNPQSRAPIHHRSKTSHGTFRSIPVFRTCTFREITPSLLKSPTRKARNEFQLPALANIRSTSPTRDATDSKSRRFLETSANPTHVPRGCGTL